MSQPTNLQSLIPEGKISLAMSAIDRNQFQSVRAATKTYNVTRTTLRRQRDKICSRRDSKPNSKKLTDLEELVIIQHILDLDSQGFSPRLAAVEDMANKLLAAHRKDKVGVNWASNFVKRTPELKTRFNCKYDYQRAQNED